MLNQNPKLFSQFFNRKYEDFIFNHFKQFFGMKDYWFRVEFQHRGSPHIHGIVWLNGAPDITLLNRDSSAETIDRYKYYYDSLISACNPSPGGKNFFQLW